MQAAEIMTIRPITAGPDDPVRRVIHIFAEANIRHIPVVERDELIGMVSDRDVRDYSIPFSMELTEPELAQARIEEPVRSIMRGDPITVDPETDVREVVELLLEEKIGAVPVVDEHTKLLEGIISYEDILRAALPLL